jgi:hypothetical protein
MGWRTERETGAEEERDCQNDVRLKQMRHPQDSHREREGSMPEAGSGYP